MVRFIHMEENDDGTISGSFMLDEEVGVHEFLLPCTMDDLFEQMFENPQAMEIAEQFGNQAIEIPNNVGEEV